MSKIIPKESLSAYQRWELNAFDEQPDGPSTPMSQADVTEVVTLPTAEEIERIQQQAHQEGYSSGYQEGRAHAQHEAQRLQRLVGALNESLQQFDQRIANDMLALTLDIAKQVLRESLRVRPELLLSVIREAINTLPQAHQHPVLVLHPDDAALVRTHLGSELDRGAWRIQDDSRLQRGGCRIETSASDMDATIENRWRRLVMALGKDDSWLD